jgi:hypothetical protein
LKNLSENAPLSIANSKTIIEEFAKASGEPDHARMKASIERCRSSSDAQEGRRAFMEKKSPTLADLDQAQPNAQPLGPCWLSRRRSLPRCR